jgi:signal transduction histidine kinase
MARDIHDSVIQPYIGLQLGLASIRQKVERGEPDVLQQVQVLSDLTAKGIEDLRHYVGTMKTGERESNNLLVPAIRRFAARFTEATGISVKVEAPDHLGINDRLAAELFQMITEGLSNIRRHTHARVARTILSQQDGNVRLRIENEDLNGENSLPFFPRSLTERAAALGGQLQVHRNGNQQTIVDIQIPL